MKVSEIGEFGLIDLLSGMAYAARDEKQAAWKQLILGIGDDAAAWREDGSIQLATADLLIEDVHFSLDFTPWEDLGWRAMAANLSDIAAMGGLPRYAIISLALPGSTEVDDVVSLYRGMLGLAGKHGTAIAGGDMSGSEKVVINITILGSTGGRDRHIMTRSAARPGDKIAVTGCLGASGGGLEMLKKKLKLNAAAKAALGEAFLRPAPRVAEGQLLAGLGVKAAIDISDGLISDLGHICQMSRVSARLEAEKIPVHPAVRENFGDSALKMALTGGEDYELLFTAPEEVIINVKEKAACPVTVIGEITAAGKEETLLVDGKGSRIDLPGKGWEHFSK
jgi:thiamine-monophosphate kinase